MYKNGHVWGSGSLWDRFDDVMDFQAIPQGEESMRKPRKRLASQTPEPVLSYMPD